MTRSKPSELQDLIARMQSLQTQHREENQRLRRRLEWLESRRREFFEVMTANASDQENRRKLDDAERQIDELQATLTQADAGLKSSLQEIRQRILVLRNEELTRLEDEGRSLRERREHIRIRLLPAAQARVSALQEEEGKLEKRFDDLSRRIRELNELDPTQTNQSQVA
jgi:hypothetical protein